MVDLVTPATEWDLAELLGVCSPMVWGLARAQLCFGPSWVLRDGDGAFAAAGLAEIEGWAAHEFWMIAAPRAARHTLRMVRVARLTILPTVDAPIMGRARTEAGRRLLRLCGFAPVEGDVLRLARGT